MFTLILLLVVCLCVAYLLYQDLSRPSNYPPGPRGLPIFGNTSLIRNLAKKLGGQHVVFSHLANEHKTSVVGLKLGRQLVAVAVAPSAVRQVLTKEEYVGRPDNFFLRLRCFGARRGITFADGDLWHNQRAFTLRTLRDVGMGKPRMENLILEQVKELVQQFQQIEGSLNPMDHLSPCILRVLWEVVAGERLPPNHPQLLRLIEILNKRNRAFDMAGGLLSQFPWIRHIAPQWSGYQLLIQLNHEMSTFLSEAIQQHRATFNENKPRDLIDTFLQQIKQSPDQSSSYFTDEQLVMVLVDLFLGGASSTTTTLNFALLLMIIYPDIQEKVYQEISSIVGSHRLPSPEDRPRLVYTEAVLLEVQRLCSVIPITGPRRVLKDTTLDGYFLPKNTTVLMSQWSVHHDPQSFPDPEKFLPERFLDPNLRARSLENLLPFGLGKRRCLGESLAKPCLLLLFAGIIHSFQLSSPFNPSEPPPSLHFIPGIILTPKPYKAVFTVRNPQVE